MRKTLLVLALASTLGACSTLQNIQQAFSIVSQSGANPITKTELYKVESAISIVFTALNTYRAACVAGNVDKNCKANIAAIQQYTRQIPPYLAQLRTFVKNNDQINAQVVYNQLTTLYNNAKATAASLGVNLGA